MSTILKALRRLEDDRAVHEQRPLRETVTAGAGDSPQPSRGRRGWIVSLVLLLGVGSGAGYLAFQSAVDGDGTQSAPAQAATSEAPTVQRLTAPSGPAEPLIAEPNPAAARESSAPLPDGLRELPEAAFSSPVARLDRPQAAPRINDSDPVPPGGRPSRESPDAEPVGDPAPAPPPRLVRGKPLVPPAQLPGRHPGVAVPPVVDRFQPTQPAPVADPEPPAAEPVVRKAAPPPKSAPPAREKPAPVVARAEPAPAPQRVAPAPPPELRAEAAPPEAPPASDERPSRVEVTSVAASESVAPVKPPEPVPPPAPEAPPDTSVARAEVPDLVVERTSWHPSAERRTANVRVDAEDAVEVHEGDAVGPLVVARIEPSGVVFVHEGIEIRRRVGQR